MVCHIHFLKDKLMTDGVAGYPFLVSDFSETGLVINMLIIDK